MKKRTIFIRIALFCIGLLLLLVYFTQVFKDKRVEGEYNVTTKVRGFYEEEKNSLDYLFLGSSQLYSHIAPGVLWKEYGATSYDFAANEQPLWITYYYLKEALKTQRPKVIVLEVFTVYADEFEDEGVNHINLDDLPFSVNKIMAIRDSVPRDQQYSFYFELAKYHSTWSGYYPEKYKQSFVYEKDPLKGYSPFVFARTYKDSAKAEVKNVSQVTSIAPKSKEWLLNIIELAKDEEIPILLLKTPNGNAERQSLYLDVEKIANEENVPFLNLNEILDGEAHVNVIQAEKITKYVGEYLTQKYPVKDKRSDNAYEEWNTDSERFYRYLAKCELANAVTLEDYMRALRNNRYIVACSGYGKMPSELQAFGMLGESVSTNDINVNEHYYISVFDGENVLLETIDDAPIEERILVNEAEYLISAAKDESQAPKFKIMCNNVDYSINTNGYNLFIFDPVLKEPIEMIAIDEEGNFLRR